MTKKDTALSFYTELVIVGIVSWMAGTAWNSIFEDIMKRSSTTMLGRVLIASFITFLAIVVLYILFGDDNETFDYTKYERDGKPHHHQATWCEEKHKS